MQSRPKKGGIRFLTEGESRGELARKEAPSPRVALSGKKRNTNTKKGKMVGIGDEKGGRGRR